MTDAGVRDAWLAYCEQTLAHASKEPNGALPHIADRYARLSDTERPVIERLLAEQILPDDPVEGAPWYKGENARFLPLFLISEFRISSAVPELRLLADWLETQITPGAPYEWAKVNGVIAALGAPTHDSGERRTQQRRPAI